MLYNFFNILTITVLLGSGLFCVAPLMCLAVMKFFESDLGSQCFVILAAVMVLSAGFQIFDKIRLDIETRETEQHKINN